ncbi:MAG: carbamoyl-phosphate synthase large subunit, partial [Candidatus Gastranaerophilales bacterium]|nr:carbamoyl-phosphate synthase large subunit [Candidatus Gastranaerophilales bacterium]
EMYLEAKEKGFLDEEIANYNRISPEEIEKLRKENSISASFKMVDTCAAEFKAYTPYYYSTYNEKDELSSDDKRKKILILGSGPIRIGQGIEFDYCSVHAAWEVKNSGYESLIVNSNPETLSTDFDIADKLFFEPMHIENIMNIIEKESPEGVMVQFGGQTAINLAPKLNEKGVKILGTSLESINIAEDRKLFEQLLRDLKIPQPKGFAVKNQKEALEAANKIGYPLLVRPSYVIGGRGMQVVYNKEELISYIEGALKFSDEHPILIDQYIEGTELELDAISDGENVLIPAITEHIERAGIHSGDSIALYPTRTIPEYVIKNLEEYTQKIARALCVKGLMNIQFVLKENTAYIIEVNPRASRTVPILSKVTNIPMVKIAIDSILGKTIIEQGYTPGLQKTGNLVCAKVPIFSFQKLNRIDPALAPEMKSTGEVLGIDNTYAKALAKGFLAAGYKLSSERGNVLISINDHYKQASVEIAKELSDLGYNLIATTGTHNYLKKYNIESKEIEKFDIKKIQRNMKNKELCFIINTPTTNNNPYRYGSEDRGFLIRTLAEMYSTPCFTVIDTAKAYLEALKCYNKNRNSFTYDSIDVYRDSILVCK